MAVLGSGRKRADAVAAESPDVSSLVRGRWVTSVGRFASMSHQQFLVVIETLGGKYTTALTSERQPAHNADKV